MSIDTRNIPFSLNLLNILEYNRECEIRGSRYIKKLVLNEHSCYRFLKKIKYVTECENPDLSNLNQLFSALKTNNHKNVAVLPYIANLKTFQIRKQYPNVKSLFFQLSNVSDWKEYTSKFKFQSIILSTHDFSNVIHNNDLLDSQSLAQFRHEAYRFRAQMKKMHNLRELSLSGNIDNTFTLLMDTLENELPSMPSFGILKFKLGEDNLNTENISKIYKCYQYVREIEFKSSVEVSYLSHFENNINSFKNLETLVIKISDISPNGSLEPLSQIYKLEKIKNYFLGLGRVSERLLEEYLKFHTIPKGIEKHRIVYLDGCGFEKASHKLLSSQEFKIHCLPRWFGLTKMKDFQMVIELKQHEKFSYLGLFSLILQGCANLESLNFELRVKKHLDEDPYSLSKFIKEDNVIDIVDFLRNFMRLVPKLQNLSLNYPLISLMNLHSYIEKLQVLKTLSLQSNIIGSRNIYHLYELMVKKKQFNLSLSQVLIENNDSMSDLIDTIPAMAKNIKGVLNFRLSEQVDADEFTNYLIKLIKKCKINSELKLFFYINDIKRVNLEKIGKVAFKSKRFQKLEIHSSNHVFIFGIYDDMYHIFNIDMENESESSNTDSSSDDY